MPEKEEIKDIYDKLSDDNKEILNMVAQGMAIAQSQNDNEHVPHVD